MHRMIAQLSLLMAVACLGVARAETKVTISGTHLCCGQCLKAVDAALKDLPSVKHKSSQEAKTIELTGDSDAAAQQAIDALAAAGFYGQLDNNQVKYQPVAADKLPVEKLAVSGVHNCCGACTAAIKKAVNSVSGVTGTNVKAKEESFTIEGKFKPAEVVQALLDAGFYVQVKK